MTHFTTSVPDAEFTPKESTAAEPGQTVSEFMYVPVRFPYAAADGVAVRRRGMAMDVVLDTGTVRTMRVSVPMEPIEDRDRQIAVLRTVAQTLSAREAQASTEAAEQTAAREDVLRRIRSYAIRRRIAGDICQSDLDAFLAAFDMEPYEVRVEFTVTGSYLVQRGDCTAARNHAAKYLRVDLSQIDDADEDSLNFEVVVSGARSTEDDE